MARGNCASCHNGATAPGKPAKHLMTSGSCDNCHRTTVWIPATFAHTGVAPNTCASCHNGASAKGKPSGHFVSSRSCDACHRTTAWVPPTAYRHVSPAFRPHSGGVRCASCHTTGNEVVVWKSAAFKPDCAGCHANAFKPEAHVKVAAPRILYTAAELRDCSGSCHEYANTPSPTVKKPKAGHHRPTDGGF